MLLVLAGCATRAPLLRGQLTGPAAVELDDVPFHAQREYQCGPAALAMLLGQSSVSLTPDALVPEVYLPGREGSLQPELVASVRRHERLAYVMPVREGDIDSPLGALVEQLRAGHAVLVLQNLGLRTVPVWHYAVVIGYSIERDEILLHSGDSERLALDARAFERSWALADHWALLALAPAELPAAPDADTWVAAAAGLEATRHYAAARDAYAAALRAWPRHGFARLGLANTLYALGDRAAAERNYRVLIAAEPANAVARNNLASLLAERGCIAEARLLLAAARRVPGLEPALRAQLEQTSAEIEHQAHSSSACSSSSISL